MPRFGRHTSGSRRGGGSARGVSSRAGSSGDVSDISSSGENPDRAHGRVDTPVNLAAIAHQEKFDARTSRAEAEEAAARVAAENKTQREVDLQAFANARTAYIKEKRKEDKKRSIFTRIRRKPIDAPSDELKQKSQAYINAAKAYFSGSGFPNEIQQLIGSNGNETDLREFSSEALKHINKVRREIDKIEKEIIRLGIQHASASGDDAAAIADQMGVYEEELKQQTEELAQLFFGLYKLSGRKTSLKEFLVDMAEVVGISAGTSACIIELALVATEGAIEGGLRGAIRSGKIDAIITAAGTAAIRAAEDLPHAESWIEAGKTAGEYVGNNLLAGATVQIFSELKQAGDIVHYDSKAVAKPTAPRSLTKDQPERLLKLQLPSDLSENSKQNFAEFISGILAYIENHSDQWEILSAAIKDLLPQDWASSTIPYHEQVYLLNAISKKIIASTSPLHPANKAVEIYRFELLAQTMATIRKDLQRLKSASDVTNDVISKMQERLQTMLQCVKDSTENTQKDPDIHPISTIAFLLENISSFSTGGNLSDLSEGIIRAELKDFSIDNYKDTLSRVAMSLTRDVCSKILQLRGVINTKPLETNPKTIVIETPALGLLSQDLDEWEKKILSPHMPTEGKMLAIAIQKNLNLASTLETRTTEDSRTIAQEYRNNDLADHYHYIMNALIALDRKDFLLQAQLVIAHLFALKKEAEEAIQQQPGKLSIFKRMIDVTVMAIRLEIRSIQDEERPLLLSEIHKIVISAMPTQDDTISNALINIESANAPQNINTSDLVKLLLSLKDVIHKANSIDATKKEPLEKFIDQQIRLNGGVVPSATMKDMAGASAALGRAATLAAGEMGSHLRQSLSSEVKWDKSGILPQFTPSKETRDAAAKALAARASSMADAARARAQNTRERVQDAWKSAFGSRENENYAPQTMQAHSGSEVAQTVLGEVENYEFQDALKAIEDIIFQSDSKHLLAKIFASQLVTTDSNAALEQIIYLEKLRDNAKIPTDKKAQTSEIIKKFRTASLIKATQRLNTAIDAIKDESAVNKDKYKTLHVRNDELSTLLNTEKAYYSSDLTNLNIKHQMLKGNLTKENVEKYLQILKDMREKYSKQDVNIDGLKEAQRLAMLALINRRLQAVSEFAIKKFGVESKAKAAAQATIASTIVAETRADTEDEMRAFYAAIEKIGDVIRDNDLHQYESEALVEKIANAQKTPGDNKFPVINHIRFLESLLSIVQENKGPAYDQIQNVINEYYNSALLNAAQAVNSALEIIDTTIGKYETLEQSYEELYSLLRIKKDTDFFKDLNSIHLWLFDHNGKLLPNHKINTDERITARSNEIEEISKKYFEKLLPTQSLALEAAMNALKAQLLRISKAIHDKARIGSASPESTAAHYTGTYSAARTAARRILTGAGAVVASPAAIAGGLVATPVVLAARAAAVVTSRVSSAIKSRQQKVAEVEKSTASATSSQPTAPAATAAKKSIWPKGLGSPSLSSSLRSGELTTSKAAPTSLAQKTAYTAAEATRSTTTSTAEHHATDTPNRSTRLPAGFIGVLSRRPTNNSGASYTATFNGYGPDLVKTWREDLKNGGRFLHQIVLADGYTKFSNDLNKTAENIQTTLENNNEKGYSVVVEPPATRWTLTLSSTKSDRTIHVYEGSDKESRKEIAEIQPKKTDGSRPVVLDGSKKGYAAMIFFAQNLPQEEQRIHGIRFDQFRNSNSKLYSPKDGAENLLQAILATVPQFLKEPYNINTPLKFDFADLENKTLVEDALQKLNDDNIDDADQIKKIVALKKYILRDPEPKAAPQHPSAQIGPGV